VLAEHTAGPLTSSHAVPPCHNPTAQASGSKRPAGLPLPRPRACRSRASGLLFPGPRASPAGQSSLCRSRPRSTRLRARFGPRGRAAGCVPSPGASRCPGRHPEGDGVPVRFRPRQTLVEWSRWEWKEPSSGSRERFIPDRPKGWSGCGRLWKSQ